MRVQRAFSHNCSFNIQQASLYNLPYKDEIFDIILCNQVLEHIPDLLNALCELYRDQGNINICKLCSSYPASVVK
ncbi:MAG: class I SAM-dependent methyltransferase [Proteobacteria bacterium]|nr:class I SAM-dependent methyltransferase [Pseudomonadota bacterium]MBU4288186.1 class I SAM-dependent methyltransferase [Pseudomonadota bacterium]MBU4415086.1 class I SAM-dependent methyltransferase [Pseudomonadota bacterium]